MVNHNDTNEYSFVHVHTIHIQRTMYTMYDVCIVRCTVYIVQTNTCIRVYAYIFVYRFMYLIFGIPKYIYIY